MAEGIRQRHSRGCRTNKGGATCNCSPSWEAFVYLKREQRKVRKTFPTKAAARSWRADTLAAAQRGKVKGPTSTTVRQAADELIAGMRDGSIANRKGHPYKPAAVRGYERALRLRVLPTLGHVKLTELTRADVQDLADRLQATLKPSTVQNTMDPLRVIFRRAIQRDLLTVDPTDNLVLHRPKGRRDRIATPAEARTLLAALPQDDRALWATAFYAGLRRGELRALRWSDVDLDAGLLHVARGWDDEEGEQDVKSDAGFRDVPIVEDLRGALVEHKLRTGRRDGQLVFGAGAERPFEPSTVRRRALTAWEDVDVEPIGLHEARHTCASVFIQAGANPKVIQSIMGHASITMTFDQYGHLMAGGLDEAREAVNAYLARSV